MHRSEQPEKATSPPEPWTPPRAVPESQFFTADDGVRLHYLEWPSDPDAPTVVLLHGRRAHAHWFDPLVNDLSPRYRLIALDLRGHGRSESNGPAKLTRYAADVAQLAREVRRGPVLLVAHSFAGRLAIMACQDFGLEPDLFVLVDAPIYRRPRHDHPENRMIPKRYGSRETAIQRFRLLPPDHSVHPDLMRYLAEHALREDSEGKWGWQFDEDATVRPFGADFPRPEDLGLEGFQCPALVMYGEFSRLNSVEEAEKVAARLPRGECLALPESYHHLMLDRPAAFNRALSGFFQKHGF